jgi:uncharacterized protein (TIGR02145 family)
MTTATATDVSSSGNDGTLTNSPQRTIGKVGQALSFDGVDDYVSIAPTSAINNLGPMSISAWQYVNPNASFGDDIMTKISGGGVLSFLFRSYWSSPVGRVEFVVKYGSQNLTVTSVSNSAEREKWQNLVVTWDGTASSSGVAIYVDGQEVSSYQTLVDGTGARSDDSTMSLYLSNNSSNRLEGLLDDVRLYNRALSADEVAQLYTLGGGSKIKICREEAVQDADGNWYNTIAIGSQCWLDRNMNVGTRINASTNQTNNGTIEKYCYSNSDANCTTNNPNKPDGGLYQWNEAMQYSTTEGAQGICPVGFRIPVTDDFIVLGKYVSNQISDCSVSGPSSYVCNQTVLNKISAGGASGFEANTTGYITGGASVLRTFFGRYWMSQEFGSDAVINFIAPGSGIFSSNSEKTAGVSVRCVQD